MILAIDTNSITREMLDAMSPDMLKNIVIQLIVDKSPVVPEPIKKTIITPKQKFNRSPVQKNKERAKIGEASSSCKYISVYKNGKSLFIAKTNISDGDTRKSVQILSSKDPIECALAADKYKDENNIIGKLNRDMFEEVMDRYTQPEGD